MKTAFIVIICFVVIGAQSAPSTQYIKQKITFSTATSIDYKSIQTNDNPALIEGTQEYYKALRLVYVTSDGYEYTEPIEDVIEYMKNIPSNDDTLKQILVEKRTVIGTDTRQLVQPDAFPYHTMGRFDLGCTGTFIAPGVIMTSAHCLYDHTNGWYSASSLKFRREKGCDPDSGFLHTWKKSVILDGYKTNRDIKYDIGLVIVKETSPVHMPYIAATTIPLSTINIAGYPLDKPKKCLWLSSCTIAETTPYFIKYPCDTASGTSGSPVYYPSGSNPGVIYAVHGFGATGNPPLNKAVRITKDIEVKLTYAMNRHSDAVSLPTAE